MGLAASNLVGKVHILSHSMGTRIASSALQVVLRQEKNENLMKKIGLYMFKQSDEQIVNMTETLKMLNDVKTETLEMQSDEISGCIPVILSHKNDDLSGYMVDLIELVSLTKRLYTFI